MLVNQAPHQLDLWQWICGVPKSVYSKVAYGFRRDIAVEDEVTAVVDYGDGATGVFVTAVHDLVGTDRFEILGDKGKIVVEGSKTAYATRLVDDERTLSNKMSMDDVVKMFMGQFDPKSLYETETIEFDTPWGEQHAGVLRNFAAHILDGEVPADPAAFARRLNRLVVKGLGILPRPLARFFAAANAIEMGFLTFILYWGNGFSWLNRGYEFTLMWGFLCLAIALRGGGPYSLDRAIGREL